MSHAKALSRTNVKSCRTSGKKVSFQVRHMHATHRYCGNTLLMATSKEGYPGGGCRFDLFGGEGRHVTGSVLASEFTTNRITLPYGVSQPYRWGLLPAANALYALLRIGTIS